MTPQNRLAVKIMSECGMTPRQIVFDPGWLEEVSLAEVARVLEINVTKRSSIRRTNVWITAGGETKTLMQWSRVTGINYWTLMGRKKRKWSPEEIVGQKPMINLDAL